jgi:hypothetical protein
LDYKVQAPPGAPIEKKVEVVRRMPSKLPWLATAVIIVVAVAAGAWFLVSPGPATVSGFHPLVSLNFTAQPIGPDMFALTLTGVGLLEGTYGKFGIENIYIIRDNFPESNTTQTGDDLLGSVYATISQNGQTVNIPYEENFGFAIEFVVRGDNVAYFTLENVYVYFTFTQGQWAGTVENMLDNPARWVKVRLQNTTKASTGITDNAPANAVGKYYRDSAMRVRAILENRTGGTPYWYKLPAGASTQFQVTVYSWK